MEERMARIEGAFEQMNQRLNDLRNEMNQRLNDFRNDTNHRFGMLHWEVRIWFLVLLIVMVILKFV